MSAVAALVVNRNVGTGRQYVARLKSRQQFELLRIEAAADRHRGCLHAPPRKTGIGNQQNSLRLDVLYFVADVFRKQPGVAQLRICIHA